MHEPMTVPVSPTLHDLGWDPGWAAAFLPFDAAGWRPARVVAAHRDAWVVATPGGDRDAVIAGRLRHEAVGPADLPAVGDWVAIGHGGSAAIDGEPDHVHANEAGPAVIQAVVPRRTAFGRSTADRVAGPAAARRTSRSSRPTSTSRWSSPASTATSTCAASSATSRSRGPAAPRR